MVERPAAVLKELVENAFDAGATQVDVEIAAGGRKLVSVSDNGSGLNRDDALLAVERHATSKISDVDDIERISSLGFRGEALAAVAAVSRFRMQTCREGEDTGTEIVISGGKMQDVRDAGCPAGTRIEVRDLFFNVPARRKFLRSYQTELAHLRSGFVVHALARPEKGMSLSVDGRKTYSLPRNAGIEDRICDLFGADRLRTLKKVRHSTDEVKVTGYVSVPSITRANRNEQYVFVNGRATSAPVIGFAIREGYRALIPDGRFPAVFLFIETDPELVDVNVHPTKREVRFRHPSEVRDAVIESVRRALSTDAEPLQAPSTIPIDEPPSSAPPRATEDAYLPIEDLPPPKAFMYPRLAPIESMTTERTAPDSPGSGNAPGDGESSAPHPVSGVCDSPWVWCRVLGQIGGLYVVLETEDGMVMMDPHAAHERVLFERFTKAVSEGSVQSQSLLMPETVELQSKDAALVRRNGDLLKEMGFGISEFGGDSFVVDALPSYFAHASPQALLPDIARELEEGGARGGRGRWREDSIAQAACKSAVKARDRLTVDEIERLVVDLSRAGMPYTCPHGRPTLIYTSFKEINSKFGRQ